MAAKLVAIFFSVLQTMYSLTDARIADDVSYQMYSYTLFRQYAVLQMELESTNWH